MLKASQLLMPLSPCPCSLPALWSHGRDPVMRLAVSSIYVNVGRDSGNLSLVHFTSSSSLVGVFLMDEDVKIESVARTQEWQALPTSPENQGCVIGFPRAYVSP